MKKKLSENLITLAERIFKKIFSVNKRISTKIKIIILSALFIFAALTFSILKITSKNKKLQNEDIVVKIVKPEIQKINPTIETFGTVVYKSKNEITSLVAGTVIEKKVKEGDEVKRGQILYKLKNIELEIQHAQNLNNLNSALANVKLFDARLNEKKQEIESRLLQIENKNLEITQIKNKIESTKEKFSKSEELKKLGGVTEQSIKDMQDEIFNLETSLKIMKKELEIISIGFTKADLQKDGIEPSDDKEKFLEQLIFFNTKTSLADLDVAKAEYENAKKSLSLVEKLLNDLIIKSPIDGIVGITYFEQGEHVSQNEKILMVMDTSTCNASFNIQENNIFDIELGSKTFIEIPAINQSIESTISEIAPYADTSTGLFNIKSNFSNTNNLIKPGMFLRCTIQNENAKEYFSIPESALINLTDKNAEIFSVKNNLAILQKINIDFFQNGNAFVKSGLEKNQIVINEPSKNLKEGSHVKIL